MKDNKFTQSVKMTIKPVLCSRFSCSTIWYSFHQRHWPFMCVDNILSKLFKGWLDQKRLHSKLLSFFLLQLIFILYMDCSIYPCILSPVLHPKSESPKGYNLERVEANFFQIGQHELFVFLSLFHTFEEFWVFWKLSTLWIWPIV